MTDELERIRERLEAVSPTPWVRDPSAAHYTSPDCHIWGPKGPGRGLVATTDPHGKGGPQKRADAALIAHAPTDIARLLDVAEVARGLIEHWDEHAIYVEESSEGAEHHNRLDRLRTALHELEGEDDGNHD